MSRAASSEVSPGSRSHQRGSSFKRPHKRVGRKPRPISCVLDAIEVEVIVSELCSMNGCTWLSSRFLVFILDMSTHECITPTTHLLMVHSHIPQVRLLLEEGLWLGLRGVRLHYLCIILRTRSSHGVPKDVTLIKESGVGVIVDSHA